MKAHQRKSREKALSGPSEKAFRQDWIWGEGALEKSAEALAKRSGPFLLVGEAHLLSPWRRRISHAWIEAGIEIQVLSFPEGAECCEPQMNALVDAAKTKKSATLIAWGGGKCIDSVKWAGQLLGLPVLSVPTSSATCACASQVVVCHSETGVVLDLIDLDAAPILCIADTEILTTAPRRLLSAGMSDTLAKWLEWKAVEEPQGAGSEEAMRARDIVMDASASQELLWEANLRLSSLASNLGGAPAAAAHSFCAGMSLLPQAGNWLHGEWVGLGLLFQAKLLNEDEEALRRWLQRQGLLERLPFSLSEEDAQAVACRILAEDESIMLTRGAEAFDTAQILKVLSAISE